MSFPETNDKASTYVGVHLNPGDHQLLILLQSKIAVATSQRQTASDIIRLALQRMAQAEGLTAQ